MWRIKVMAKIKRYNAYIYLKSGVVIKVKCNDMTATTSDYSIIGGKFGLFVTFAQIDAIITRQRFIYTLEKLFRLV